MSVKKMGRSEVVTISEQASIQEAAKLMKEKQVGCLLVLKEKDDTQNPIGIITDRDITVKIVAQKNDLSQVTVKDAMSSDLLMVPHDQEIQKSLEAMRSKGVRRAPVTENNKVCGLLTADDVMIMIAGELNQLAELVKAQLSGRK